MNSIVKRDGKRDCSTVNDESLSVDSYLRPAYLYRPCIFYTDSLGNAITNLFESRFKKKKYLYFLCF